MQGLPGAQELVSHLASQGHPVAVASSARKEELEGLLRCAGVERLIKLRTSSSDAEQSKPDPDIIQAALENLGCAASEAVMVGDTPYDIEAARRAGVETIAFRTAGGGMRISGGPSRSTTVRRICGGSTGGHRCCGILSAGTEVPAPHCRPPPDRRARSSERRAPKSIVRIAPPPSASPLSTSAAAPTGRPPAAVARGACES